MERWDMGYLYPYRKQVRYFLNSLPGVMVEMWRTVLDLVYFEFGVL